MARSVFCLATVAAVATQPRRPIWSICTVAQSRAKCRSARARRTIRIAGRCVRRRPAAAARLRRRPRAVPDRLPDLRHAQRRPHQCGADLPCADRRPACRQRPSRHRQAGLVGDHGRPGQADRHRPLFRHLPQRASAAAWAPTGPASINPQTGKPGASTSRSSPSATWCGRRRCCSTISASTRCSASPAARWAACRCCNGRRAIRSACSPRCRSPAATRHSAQNIAFHEVGRQAVMADPDWRARPLFAEGTNPRRGLAVARMAAHITYLSDAALHRKFGRRLQDRANADLLVRRRFPGGELSAPSGHQRSSSASTPTPIST